ncbi:MAG: EAL domain-containing protein [Hyphomonadaceae bacterium]
MFRRLRAKLTVLYAGLFCLALMLIGASASFVITRNAKTLTAAELNQVSGSFTRDWSIRLAHLRGVAAHYANNHDLPRAAHDRDDPAIRAGLSGLRESASADLAFVITREGLIISESGARSSVSPGLQMALANGEVTPGIMSFGGTLYQAAAAPISENGGWLIVGERVDNERVAAFSELSEVPMRVAILARGTGGWSGQDFNTSDVLDAFIDRSWRTPQVEPLRTGEGPAQALATPLPSLDGTQAVLFECASLADMLSPYATLLGSLIVIGLAGLVFLVASSWFMARGITEPMSTLEYASRKLREGVYEAVTVKGRDEFARLAESFNAMVTALRERERRITHLAFHDGETRLPNRAALERRISSAEQPERLYLAAIGVDRFDHVRGAIGFALTADLMRKLGARLARLLPHAPLGRLASDVLGVAFIATSEADALKRARALVANLEQPVSLGEHNVDVHVTIGLAPPAQKGETHASVLERASIALDQTRKRRQKAGVYDGAAYGDPSRNLSLMGELRRALETGAIELVHQPKYNFRTGVIDSAESLVRWVHPARGPISPELFVPMAEETGHIRALTEWVLERAVAEQKILSDAGWPLTLAVNISARLLGDGDFIERAAEIAGPVRHKLCFEITETAVIDNPVSALVNLELFAASGLRIAIDDYGSGLSSLSYLKQLPAQELKIDKMFIQNITSSQRDALLVRSTIDLAHGLGMYVTAEGVETPAAFSLLAGMNCDLAQGYLISRPVPVDELITLLSDERRLRFYKQTAAGAPNLAEARNDPKTA